MVLNPTLMKSPTQMGELVFLLVQIYYFLVTSQHSKNFLQNMQNTWTRLLLNGWKNRLRFQSWAGCLSVGPSQGVKGRDELSWDGPCPCSSSIYKVVLFQEFCVILEHEKKEIKLRAELEAAAIADEIRLVLKPIKLAWIVYDFYPEILLSFLLYHHKDTFPNRISSWSATKMTITATLVKYLAKGSNKIFICIQLVTFVAWKRHHLQMSVHLPDSSCQFINWKRLND